MSALFRFLMKLWGLTSVAPGYRYHIIERYAPRLATAKPLSSKLPNGIRVSCDLRDHVQRHIYYWGLYEPVESWVFTQLLKPGDTMFDAGANVGQYSLLASTIVQAQGSVHSFEPAAVNRQKLSESIANNGLVNIRLNGLALWDRPEVLTMKLDQADLEDLNFGSYSAQQRAVDENGPFDETDSVQAIRIDDYVSENRLQALNVIKMDIEGSEYRALQGSRATLIEFRPMILMELNQLAAQNHGGDLGDLWRLLVDELGYDLFAIEPSPRPPVRLESIKGIERMNVVAVHKDSPKPAVLDLPMDLKTILAWARSGQ